MTTGEKIKQARKKAGLTQKQLADMLNISPVNISQIENDYRLPKIDTLQRIGAALGVDWKTLPVKVREITLYEKAPEGWQRYLHDDEIDDLEKAKIDIAYAKLNQAGREEAAKRIEELTQLPKYQMTFLQPGHCFVLEGETEKNDRVYSTDSCEKICVSQHVSLYDDKSEKDLV